MKIRNTILLAIIIGIFSLGTGIFAYNNTSIAQIILHSAFSGVEYYPQYVVFLSYQYMPLLIFQVIFATYIYKHFCSASVYFFSRNINRIKWFLEESGKLYIHTVLYLIVFNLVGIIVTSLFIKVTIDKGVLLLIVYYILIHSLYLFFSTLAINIVAIISSSEIGFIVVEGIALLQMGMYLMLGKRIQDDIIEGINLFMLKSNIIANLIFPVHSSHIQSVNKFINEKGIDFDLNFSIIYYFILSMIIIIVGAYIVKKKEFIVNNKEID